MASLAVPAARSPSRAAARPIAVATWLFAVAALVFAMVVVGGITRLTESGLSIIVMNGAVIFGLSEKFTWFGTGYFGPIPVMRNRAPSPACNRL